MAKKLLFFVVIIAIVAIAFFLFSGEDQRKSLFDTIKVETRGIGKISSVKNE